MYSAILLGMAVTLGAPAKKDEPKTEPAILGEWVAEKISIGGMALPKPKDKEIRFAFAKDGKVTITDGSEKVETGTYKMDVKKDPHEIDLMPPPDSKDPTMLGIFSVEGDKLMICIAEGKTAARPTKFESSKEAPFVLVTFKKVKK